MSLTIKNTTEIKTVAEFIALSISDKLKTGKQVLFFVTGGSSIAVCVEVAKILMQNSHQNLTIMLTDERYGPLNHPDSNWFQLISRGFNLGEARLIPILTGDNCQDTTEKFNANLKEEFKKDSYKIGLFGIGADGHTAGILPNTSAVNSPDLATTYKTEKFERITMTPKAIMQLNEVVVFAKGEDKWPTLEKLKNEVELNEQPAQILKKVPLLIMFTDYKN